MHLEHKLQSKCKIIHFKCNLNAQSTFRIRKGTFSNRSVFISLRFQINPLWIAYSNMLPFHDRFHRFRVNRRRNHENVSLRSRYDIVAFSPPVHTETMKTIMKTQTKLDLFENARI